ncbi:MAG: glycosyltransferase [Drouetiella hepatica Uher 2000/2452]|uniref:Glycosyltransferase n=1 Tax=Drouetiella hepatica Uher 2000/2452 TaxID=904376 RepID=A0A951QGZ0_9CYAN|nr:glycosyltransferase [Drouetiella hepatica Uher 2000/2452]
MPRIDLAQIPEEKNLSRSEFPVISVIIPAFNEEENIEDCVKSVLISTRLSPELLEVWLIDDQSTDRTLEILQTLQAQESEPRFKIIAGLPRPKDQLWNGKNWACHQGAEQARGDFLLFIDADVRLKPKAVSAVVQTAIDQQLDFLTCIPAIVSGSLIEWLVQPLMFINVLVTFNSKAVKDPRTKTTYALGPFLLFRADAYHTIGGHRAIAAEVAEDVAFARKLKHNGFRMQQILGRNLATLRMYRNWRTLWEGWTKVLYVGADRSVPLMLLLATVMLMIYTVPWLGFMIAIGKVLTHLTLFHLAMTGLTSLAILLQFWVRHWGSQALGTSMKYWWLQGAGGAIIAVLAIASIIKTETGWGWTWRGRKLSAVKKT